MQFGAQVQWGGDDRQLFFSDVDMATGTANTVFLDPLTGARRVLAGPLFMVANDDTGILGYDPLTSKFAQVGYGLIVPDDQVCRVPGPSAANGVFLTDVASGATTLIASGARISAAIEPAVAVLIADQFEFYVFQAKWNPQRKDYGIVLVDAARGRGAAKGSRDDATRWLRDAAGDHPGSVGARWPSHELDGGWRAFVDQLER